MSTSMLLFSFIFLYFYITNISILAHSIIKQKLQYNIKEIPKRQLQSLVLSCNAGSPTFPTRDQTTVHTAQAIALTCMDFRIVDDAACALNTAGLKNNYDAYILAGASLGYNSFSEWADSFNKHTQLSIRLHDINKIIVMDHANCGAYKLMFPNINWALINSTYEYQQHANQIENFAAAMKYYYPNLTIQAYYMSIDGSISSVTIQGTGSFTPSNDNKLHAGDIAAIVIGIILGLFIIGVAVSCFVLRKKRSSEVQPSLTNRDRLNADNIETKTQ